MSAKPAAAGTVAKRRFELPTHLGMTWVRAAAGLRHSRAPGQTGGIGARGLSAKAAGDGGSARRSAALAKPGSETASMSPGQRTCCGWSDGHSRAPQHSPCKTRLGNSFHVPRPAELLRLVRWAQPRSAAQPLQNQARKQLPRPPASGAAAAHGTARRRAPRRPWGSRVYFAGTRV